MIKLHDDDVDMKTMKYDLFLQEKSYFPIAKARLRDI